MNKYEKFPAYLRGLLETNKVSFSEDTLFEYEPFLCYRIVEREENDDSPVSMEDFKSYYEKGVKTTRAGRITVTDPAYYSISLSVDKEHLERLFGFPNKKKKMIMGYVYKEGGPSELEKNGHVNWWLYEGIEVKGYHLL